MAYNTLNYGSYTLEMPRNGFETEKEKDMFIKNCVRLARQTPEYKDWVRYVKDMLGYKTCLITGETSDEVTVEIHHHPLTIFDITNIIVSTYIKNNMKFTSMNVVNDVMTLHYNNKIGFIPLCTTWHEKYHNGFAVIPPKFITGEWNYLLTTPGYEVIPELVDKCSELMDDKNNAFDNEANNWKTITNGGIIKDE
jgi:hypothetical protein